MKKIYQHKNIYLIQKAVKTNVVYSFTRYNFQKPRYVFEFHTA